jgi:A/G-specific adenine glycosylase
VRRLRRRLLEWGEQHRRDLPWRRTRDPWRILVSEVMLQQTQVERVVPHYERFLASFPTPAACAAAGPAAVVRLWSGLGYNRRALNLHRAAAVVVAEHGGVVPHHDAALRALPGVGPYTARAVRTFAYGDDVAAVDTNGVRVLARGVAGAPLTVREATALGDRLVPAGGSWAFNQTMFDLGATVCTAARPDCARCPLRRQCAWRRRGAGGADPWRLSPTARPQSTFAGSERQGRGRLLDALRRGGVRRSRLASACGWPEDTARAERVAVALAAEGFASWSGGRDPVLRLREGPAGQAGGPAPRSVRSRSGSRRSTG